MRNHHILCVHGIGRHDHDWVNAKDDGDKSVAELIGELLAEYALSGVAPEKVKLHSIHYDDEILRLFASWEEQSKKLKDGLASSPILREEAEWFTGAIDKATAAKDAADWQFTHLLDLLLFVGSPSIQDRLVTYVGHQVIDLIETHPGDDFSLIGHSLGTAMAHKVIQALFNEGFEGRTLTLKGDFWFQTVTMIANCSYALSRDRANHYAGIVRPSLTAGAGCCLKWINVNHRLDPIGRFMPWDFRENPRWLDPNIEVRGHHRDVQLVSISSPGIHSINHYFRDPSFHIPFFELAFGKRVAKSRRDLAFKKFEAATLQGKFKSLTSHLETLDVSTTESFRDFYTSLRAFIDLLKQFQSD